MPEPGISYRDWVRLSESGSALLLTIETGTEVLDLEHVKNPRLREITEISPVGGQVVIKLSLNNGNIVPDNEFTFKRGMDVGCIGVLNHNLASGNTVNAQIKHFVDDPFTGSTVSINLNLQYFNNYFKPRNSFGFFEYNDIKPFYSQVTEVTLTFAGLSKNLKIGRLWIGNYMDIIFDKEWGHGYYSKSKNNESKGLDVHPIYQRRRKKYSFPIQSIKYDQAYGTRDAGVFDVTSIYDPEISFDDMAQTVGKDSDILVFPKTSGFYDIKHTSVYGMVTNDIWFTHNGGDYFDTDIDVMELI